MITMYAAHAPSPGEYIVHHLGHLNNLGKAQSNIVDWSVVNYDTLACSIILGLLTVFILWRAARKATSGVPGRFQGCVEVLVEMVANQAKNIVHSPESRRFVAPVALTVFIWVFFLNAMDLVPVDALPLFWQRVVMGDPDAYLRVVATADLSSTFGLSVSVLLLCLYYNIKIKGLTGWVHELFTAPFGSHPLLWPINLIMQIIEFLAKTVSHGMRLWGNMYAGELIFMLIALMGGAWTLSATGVFLGIGHIIAGTAWAIFHILIITLQAFIFMMLALIYIGQAHEGH